MDPAKVDRIELLASSTSRYDGFESVATVDPKKLDASFEPPHEGTWILQARMLNKRGEVSTSLPVTIRYGATEGLSRIEVASAAVIPGGKKSEIYKDFVSKGGGEAAKLPGSRVLEKQGDRPVHEIEKPYRDELLAFYRKYGQNEMKAVLDSDAAIAAGSVLFDGDRKKAPRDLYNYQDTLVQARFAKPTKISRVDLHWRRDVPDRYVRLEMQTSEDADGSWYSVVNDDRAWEGSVARLGGTLLGHKLPGAGTRVSTIWFPERTVTAVRFLLTSFPSEITEIEFLGE